MAKTDYITKPISAGEACASMMAAGAAVIAEVNTLPRTDIRKVNTVPPMV